jgi:hypothetical protein
VPCLWTRRSRWQLKLRTEVSSLKPLEVRVPGRSRRTTRKITAGLFISLDGAVEAPDQRHFPYFNDEMGAAVDATFVSADTGPKRSPAQPDVDSRLEHLLERPRRERGPHSVSRDLRQSLVVEPEHAPAYLVLGGDR